MQQLSNFLDTLDGYLGSSAWFAYFLLGVGLFFTIYLKFPQIRYFRFALKIVKGKFDKADDEGDTSHFQALTTALSGTVGTGNIAGVALAIHQGGPAALFWMLVTAMLGMTTKFVEVTLSHKYRETDEKGQIAGGPMYYMKNKLNMKWLAVLFAIATLFSAFGTGNMPQINSISSSINATFGVSQWITGAVLSVLLGMVIIGGISRIAKVTEKLVPAMAFIYIVGALAVIFTNYDNIIPSFVAIFGNIFTPSAATGGFLGASFAFLFNRGVNRGLFSNEAGQGSAPIAHAAARAHEPVSEGMVALLEPFIDTIIICTITGLVLLSSGVWNQKFDNQFEMSDLEILAHTYNDQNTDDVGTLRGHILRQNTLPLFNGELEVIN
ncbi:MAG: sodium:alanine symporter family protein, partial [Bacteroidales bacterium]|nr:sodium:alanine symporter family protein [Bacteroidales bacterium]